MPRRFFVGIESRWLAEVRHDGDKAHGFLLIEIVDRLLDCVAADDAHLRNADNVARYPSLERIKPERALPRRTESVELVKGRDPATAQFFAEPAREIAETKRHAARFVSVVCVVQDHVIARCAAIERGIQASNDTELIFCWRLDGFSDGKDGLITMLCRERFRQVERIIADTVKAAWRLRHDLQDGRHLCGCIDLPDKWAR